MAQGISVAAFKAGNDLTKVLSYSTVDPRTKVPLLPGENSHQTFHAASEKGKTFSRTLLEKVLGVEDGDGCIQDFEEAHVLVDAASGEVTLQGIQILSRTEIGNLQYYQILRANYQVARQIIRNLFNPVPHDVDHLLDLMSNQFASRRLFPEHASLLHLNKGAALFKDLYDLLTKLSPAEYQQVCAAVKGCMQGDWRQGVKDNDYRLHTYNFNGVPSEYEMSSPPDFQSARSAVIFWRSNNATLSQHEKNVIDGHKILTFLRNRLPHRMEGFKVGLRTWNCVARFDFSAAHSELVVIQSLVSTSAWDVFVNQICSEYKLRNAVPRLWLLDTENTAHCSGCWLKLPFVLRLNTAH